MQWLAPWWLAAAAAVVVPLVLHLRDQQPPNVVRVGSVADLSSTPASRRRRHLDDFPLLLLRCAVIVLGAVFLAGPKLAESVRAGQRVAVVPSGMRAVADSLRAAGVPVADIAPSPFPWSLAEWADTAIGRGDTIVLVTPAGGGAYAGIRPRLAHAVEVIGSRSALDDSTTAAPPLAQRAPLLAARADTPRTSDARAMVWWILIATLLIERITAYRRDW